MTFNIFPKTLFLALLLGLLFSCSENPDQTLQSFKWDKIDLSGLSINVSPVTIDLKDYPLDQLLKDISAEIYETDINQTAKIMKISSDMELFLGANLLVDGETNRAILTPLEWTSKIPTENTRIASGDDHLICGGQVGDGWTSYGTCLSQECVTEMMLAAAEDLGEPGVGQCLDLRVVRNLLNARVCGRLTSCN